MSGQKNSYQNSPQWVKYCHDIKEGDVVLLKEVNTKPNHYPLGIVKKVVENDEGEITGAEVLKGKTKEYVKRHSSTLIPLLSVNEEKVNNNEQNTLIEDPKHVRPMRKAAEVERKLQEY